MLIRVNAETESWTTRAADPSDGWDQGDSAGRVVNVAAWPDRSPDPYLGVCAESITVDLDVQPGDLIYAVVADYSTGGTFGRSGGYASVVDAFCDQEEAERLARLAHVPRQSGEWEDKYMFSYKGKDYFRSWEGYFEELNSLDVWTVRVREAAQDNLIMPPEDRTWGHKTGH
jgi:hypothetical protein